MSRRSRRQGPSSSGISKPIIRVFLIDRSVKLLSETTASERSLTVIWFIAGTAKV